MADIENRLGEAKAAINEYRTAIGELQALEVKEHHRFGEGAHIHVSHSTRDHHWAANTARTSR